jgi:SAM-dependent methyltransferase
VITTWSKGDVEENMPEGLLLETFAKVQRHPWWQARARLALAVLRQENVLAPARILDAGCGWGTNLIALSRAGYVVEGLDVSRRALELIDAPDRRLIEADLTRKLPTVQRPFRAVLALDVIEHVDDDRGVIERLAELVGPGGTVIVSVPALPELFSEFDQIQGHRRRYLPETLAAAFKDTKLVLNRIVWWGEWMVPILRRTRRTVGANGSPPKTYSDYLRVPSWPISWVMNCLFKWEQEKALKGVLKKGTSLFAVARREELLEAVISPNP